MIINRDNYELFFIDYLDGALPEERIDDLLDFVRENPDLAEELKGLEKMHIDPENDEVDFDFQQLKKEEFDHPDVFDDACVRFIESDMADDEKDHFLLYTEKRKDKQHILNLFKATILKPNEEEIFTNKEGLKKKVRVLSSYWYAAAAVLVVGLFLVFIPQKQGIAPNQGSPDVVAQTAPCPAVKGEAPGTKNTSAMVKKEDVLATVIPATTKQKVVEEKAIVREHIEAETMSCRKVKVDIAGELAVALVPVESKKDQEIKKEYPDYKTIPEYIAEEVQKIEPKEWWDKLGMNALEKVREITNDKFNFASNKQGKLQKIEYNSKLLAFSVPVNTK